MNNNNTKTLPIGLRDSYAWTAAAGELGLLATLAGDALHAYAYKSVQDAGERNVHGIYMGDLHDLATWLRA